MFSALCCSSVIHHHYHHHHHSIPSALCTFTIQSAKLCPNRTKLVLHDYDKRIVLYNVEDQMFPPSSLLDNNDTDNTANNNTSSDSADPQSSSSSSPLNSQNENSSSSSSSNNGGSSNTSKNVAIIVTCKDVNGRETRILGVYWLLRGTHILLVLTTSIQILSVRTVAQSTPATASSVLQSKLVKNISCHIRFHVYSPEHGLLLVALEGDDTGLVPFKVSDLVKLDRFQVISPLSSSSLNSGGGGGGGATLPPLEPPIQEKELFLVTLYRKCWCVHVSIYRREMTIFKMTPENNFVKYRVFNIFSQGISHVTVSDSLLILHNHDEKLSMAYDILANQDAPVSPPMPIGTHHQSQHGDDEDAIEPYSKDWMLINPNYIIDLKHGLIFQLQLDIELMPLSIRNKLDMIKFLSRRTNSKMVLLKRVKSFITDHKESLRSISSIFNLVNRYYENMLFQRKMRRHSSMMMSTATSTTTAAATTTTTTQSLSTPITPLGDSSVTTPTTRRQSRSFFLFTGGDFANSGESPESPSSRHTSPNRNSNLVSQPQQQSTAASSPTTTAAPSSSSIAGVTTTVLPTTSSSDDNNSNNNWESPFGYPVIDQMDMYTYVFSPLDEDCTDGSSFEDGCVTTTELIALVVEYIRSLKVGGIPIQHLLQKFLIDLLVKNNDYHLLHQYIQYKVIDDSIPVAWQILHISNRYAPAYQIALDMMSRLQAYENICEILISRKEVSQALQLMYRHRISNIPYRVIFEIVVSMNDPTLFYNTMETLTKCNVRNRGTSTFTQEDKCEEFIELYNIMFGKSSY